VHSNPKYSNVKGTISSGKTVKSVTTVSKSDIFVIWAQFRWSTDCKKAQWKVQTY